MIDWSLSPASVAALAGEFLVFKVFLNISLSPKKKGGVVPPDRLRCATDRNGFFFMLLPNRAYPYYLAPEPQA